MTFAALLKLQAQAPSPVEQRLLRGHVHQVLNDEREWGANPNAELYLRTPDGPLHAHFKHLTPPRPVVMVMLRDFGHTQSQALQNECVAWQLARCLGPPYSGLVAPTVWRTDLPIGAGHGALSLHLPGEGLLAVTDPSQVDAAALFDSISWQQDRHTENYLWDPVTRRLGLIDHSFSLSASRPESPTRGGGCFLEERWWHGREQLTNTERAALTALTSTVSRLDGVLEPHRYDALCARIQSTLAKDRVALPGMPQLTPGAERLPRDQLLKRLRPGLPLRPSRLTRGASTPPVPPQPLTPQPPTTGPRGR